MVTSFDLVEQQFNIPDDEKQKEKSKSRSKKTKEQVEDLDPTRAVNECAITMIEKCQPTFVDDRLVILKPYIFAFQFILILITQQVGNENEFGALTVEELDFFYRPSNIPEAAKAAEQSDQQVPDMMQFDETPENIRNIPEVPLYDEVIDVVNKQMPTRKRRSSQEMDISRRLGDRSKIPRVEVTEKEADEAANTDISPLENIANGTENVTDISAPLEANNDVTRDDTFHNPMLLDPLEPTATSTPFVPKRKVRKSKLIIDKVTKISKEVLGKNQENYQQKLTIKSPLDTWSVDLLYKKISDESFWVKPSSRMKLAARELQPLFVRNAKRIPLNLLKRKRDFEIQTEAPKAKKSNFSSGNLVEEIDIPIETTASINQPEIPIEEMFIPEIPMLRTPPKKAPNKRNAVKELDVPIESAAPICQPEIPIEEIDIPKTPLIETPPKKAQKKRNARPSAGEVSPNYET